MSEAFVSVGTRVRLRPAHNWLSKYEGLAMSGRPGTIVALPDDRTATVVFDTKRPGTKPIDGTFARDDLMPCAIPAPAAQPEIGL